MKPLRVAWTRETLDGNTITGWLGRIVAPPSIYEPDGTPVRAVTATHAVVSWPEEALVLGVATNDGFALAWDDVKAVIDHDGCRPTHQELSATTDGAILVSWPHATLSQEADAAWTIDRRLDWRYRDVQRWALDDFAFATACLERGGRRRWLRDGRAAFVADDVVVLEQGGGATKEIVARRADDGGELWRRPASDRFVLGGVTMPAWSDDRVFVLDRGARRRAAWAREAEIATMLGISRQSPIRVLGFMNLVARTRTETPLETPSQLCCWSTRTGDELWRIAIDGDIASFHAHPRWIAIVSTASVQAWLLDGTPRTTLPITRDPADVWPPPPELWPAIAGGTGDHVVLVENEGRGSRMRCIAIDRGAIAWETLLPIETVRSSTYGCLRTTNRASVVLAGEGAFARAGRTIVGLLP